MHMITSRIMIIESAHVLVMKSISFCLMELDVVSKRMVRYDFISIGSCE